MKDSIAKAALAGWRKTTKFSHPLKLKIKWLYRNMVNRCHNPKNKRYADYGGRGIAVCDEWRNDRYAFYQWCLSAGIQPGLSIERIDRNGNYCPDNCRFATNIEQANNTRKNRFLKWAGRELTVSQWARELGVSYRAVQHRIARGWSLDRIFQQPFRGKA